MANNHHHDHCPEAKRSQPGRSLAGDSRGRPSEFTRSTISSAAACTLNSRYRKHIPRLTQHLRAEKSRTWPHGTETSIKKPFCSQGSLQPLTGRARTRRSQTQRTTALARSDPYMKLRMIVLRNIPAQHSLAEAVHGSVVSIKQAFLAGKNRYSLSTFSRQARMRGSQTQPTRPNGLARSDLCSHER